MIKVSIIFLLFLVIIGGIVFKVSKQQLEESPNLRISSNPEESVNNEEPVAVEHQARFLIFTNGTKRNFSAPRYHAQWPIAYLIADDPTIIYVSQSGTTWGEFFASLPMTLNTQCIITGTNQEFCNNGEATLKFYINGEKANDFLDREIEDGDKALITYGSENMVEINNQLDQLVNLP